MQLEEPTLEQISFYEDTLNSKSSLIDSSPHQIIQKYPRLKQATTDIISQELFLQIYDKPLSRALFIYPDYFGPKTLDITSSSSNDFVYNTGFGKIGSACLNSNSELEIEDILKGSTESVIQGESPYLRRNLEIIKNRISTVQVHTWYYTDFKRFGGWKKILASLEAN